MHGKPKHIELKEIQDVCSWKKDCSIKKFISNKKRNGVWILRRKQNLAKVVFKIGEDVIGQDSRERQGRVRLDL